MRTKKPRFRDGIQFSPNLYPDPRGRATHFSYIRPDTGKKSSFIGPSLGEANDYADALDAMIEQGLPNPAPSAKAIASQLAFHLAPYRAKQELRNPQLIGRESWKNCNYAFALFAKLPQFTYIRQINRRDIEDWWDTLSYYQQKLRHASFRKLFNYLMAEELIPQIRYNPFTTSDELPRLELKLKPQKLRSALTQPHYDQICAQALDNGWESLTIAMGISRYTTAREADVVALRWDKNIVDGALRIIVSKSVAQKGTARASRLEWRLAEHPELKALIDRARELSLIHHRCPFIVSHKPIRPVWGKNKECLYQMSADRLSRMFKEAMEAAGIKNTSFHEVRGLAATVYKDAGYTNEQIRDVMAHESVTTTIGYQDADALPYVQITMRPPPHTPPHTS